MFIIEFIVSTLVFEKLRSMWTGKQCYKNNQANITTITNEMPTFETVGELRALLENFADDVPTSGGFNYPLLQVRVLDNKGLINFGSSSHQKRSAVLPPLQPDTNKPGF